MGMDSYSGPCLNYGTLIGLQHKDPLCVVLRARKKKTYGFDNAPETDLVKTFPVYSQIIRTAIVPTHH